jgi:tetratricopeptide (TPR) repeat protein
MRFIYFVACIATISFAQPAAAFDLPNIPDMQDCAQVADLDRNISGCTRLLGSRLLSKHTRALLYNNRGIAFYRRGDFDHAIADFNQAIRENPDYAKPYDNRSLIWYEKGYFDRAVADGDQAIRLDPNLATAYNNRGNAWKNKGDYDRAIADQNEAIRLAPKEATTYSSRGESWRFKGDLDRALADQDQAVALQPNGTLVYVQRGDTIRYKGEFVRAIADYEQALRNLPGYIPALTGLGLTYEKMGYLVKARAEFEQASHSLRPERFADVSKSALETAHARLAALDSGVAQPSIPNALPKAISATSIPTPATAVPTVAPAIIKTTVAKQGRRVALVIGNSVYRSVPALANPQKDAQAIAASLRNIGFDQVTLANDATREKLIDSLRAFGDEAEKADWAMVYYAGHGLEVGGINYLVPIDARLAVDRDIQLEAVPLDQVLAAVDAAKKLKLVMPAGIIRSRHARPPPRTPPQPRRRRVGRKYPRARSVAGWRK